jgi:hypothetical protein
MDQTTHTTEQIRGEFGKFYHSPLTNRDVEIPDIPDIIRERREQASTVRPVRSTYASKIGHPCERYLVYMRVAWDLIPKASPRLEGIFRRGRTIGDDIVIEAQDALKRKGIKVVEAEVNIPPNGEDIGGRIDFGIEVPTTFQTRPLFIPVEAKSMNEHDFDAIPPTGDQEALDWFLESPKVWLRAYPSQILTYMFYRSIEWGILFVRNVATYEDKQVVLHLDLDRVQKLLDKARRVKASMDKVLPVRTSGGDWEALLPARVDYHPDVCGRCDFCPWCLPDIAAAPGLILRLNDAALDDTVRIWSETAEIRKNYEDANDAIAGHLKAIMDKEPVGATRTIVTANYGICAKKGAKSITKKIMALDELKGGSQE